MRSACGSRPWSASRARRCRREPDRSTARSRCLCGRHLRPRRVRGRRDAAVASGHPWATRMHRPRTSTSRAIRDRRSCSLEPGGSIPSWGSSQSWASSQSWGSCRPSGSCGVSTCVRAGDEEPGRTRRRPSRWQVPDRRRSGRPGSRCHPRRRFRCPSSLPCRSRSYCVRGPLGCDDAWERRFPSRFPRRPMTATRPLLRLRMIRWFVARRPSDVGRRWWSRRCLPRPGCPGSYGELPSLDARERDVGERGDRTGSVVPACGTVAVSVERTRPPAACAAAIRAARVIAHPIRPSPALAFPRSRLSGDPGPGGRRFARLLDDHSFSLVRRMGSGARRAGLGSA